MHVDLLLEDVWRKRILKAKEQLQEHIKVYTILLDKTKQIARFGLVFRNENKSNSFFMKTFQVSSGHNNFLQN